MSKFYFKPLTEKRGNDVKAIGSIYSNGQFVINHYAGLQLGFQVDKPTAVYLYEDIERRALGFKIVNSFSELNKPKHLRIVKATPMPNSEKFQFKMSIVNFLGRLDKVVLPYKSLEITQYKDTAMDTLYYIEVPKGESKKSVEEE